MSALVRHEIRRNLRPSLALPLVGFGLVLAYERVGGAWGPEYAQVQGALTLHGGWLLTSIPVFAGAVGGSLADEQRRGVTSTLLARGVPRGQYVLSKVLGAAASGALLTAAAVVAFYVLVSALWPAGRVTYERTPSGLGPVPALFMVNPLANDLLLAAMGAAAAAALSGVGVLAGTLTTNRYVAMAAPLVLFLGCTAFHEHRPHGLWNPYTYMDLTTYYTQTISAPFRPWAAFLYWGGLAAALAGLSSWIFSRREVA